jgi:alpha-L-fucosidase
MGFAGRRQALFARDLAAGKRVTWHEATVTAEIDLGGPTRVSVARLEEDIEKGQSVSRYTLFGNDGSDWRQLSTGTTIGYAKLDRFAPESITRVRLVVDEWVSRPAVIQIKLFHGTP